MKSIESHLFALLGESSLSCAGAVLSCYTDGEVFFSGSGNHLTEHLGIAGSMISFLESCLTIESTNFRITLPDRGSGHSQIHTYFCTFAGKLSTEEILHLVIKIGSDTNLMLRCPCKLRCLINRLKFGLGLFADRTFPISRKIRKFYSLFFLIIDMTADAAFVLHDYLLSKKNQ